MSFGPEVDPIAKHGMPCDEAINDAARAIGAILADPERAAQIREHMAAYDAAREAERKEDVD